MRDSHKKTLEVMLRLDQRAAAVKEYCKLTGADPAIAEKAISTYQSTGEWFAPEALTGAAATMAQANDRADLEDALASSLREQLEHRLRQGDVAGVFAELQHHLQLNSFDAQKSIDHFRHSGNWPPEIRVRLDTITTAEDVAERLALGFLEGNAGQPVQAIGVWPCFRPGGHGHLIVERARTWIVLARGQEHYIELAFPHTHLQGAQLVPTGHGVELQVTVANQVHQIGGIPPEQAPRVLQIYQGTA